jgi:hypothetical protein
MPGERRGGRTRATPNRRTILADRMLVVLSGCAMASAKACLSQLMKDAELPADIRMAIAQKTHSGRAGGGPAAAPQTSRDWGASCGVPAWPVNDPWGARCIICYRL